MTQKLRVYILFLSLASLLFACSDVDPEFNNDFKKSEKAWKAFKKSSGNTYSYEVSFDSWAGFGSRTKISVENGIIIQRQYHSYGYKDDVSPEKEVKSEWVEGKSEIGSHTNEGAPAVTLDEIYDRAENEWLIKRKGADTFFSADNGGMISSAGYVNDGCQDDCFTGIRITAITAGK
ncbi:MAG TPA: hypothetical protein VGN64_08975 [Dyadobacter sp.]|jgi:hypothetical protein|nr:hypothetical protein [Dyadobacter sp.]